jgi:hypothetical protein
VWRVLGAANCQSPVISLPHPARIFLIEACGGPGHTRRPGARFKSPIVSVSSRGGFHISAHDGRALYNGSDSCCWRGTGDFEARERIEAPRGSGWGVAPGSIPERSRPRDGRTRRLEGPGRSRTRRRGTHARTARIGDGGTRRAHETHGAAARKDPHRAGGRLGEHPDSTGLTLERITTGEPDARGKDQVQSFHGAWKNDRLHVVREGRRGRITETFSLEEGGRTLVIHTKMESDGHRPSREFKRVYRRMSA